jgi:cysteine desulfurase
MNVYLDNSATTRPSPEVLKSMHEVLEKYYGNPSSLHRLGTEAEHLLRRSRELIANLLQVASSEIIFTSGGTEGNNLAIKGIAFEYQKRGKHIITTQIEHASVYEACQALEENFGFQVTYLPVNKEGLISINDLREAIREDTILVSIMHVNNEIGTIQPIEQIGLLLKRFPKILFHVDDVQGYGKVPLSIKGSHIDLLTISGHKFHAPKGIGLLYVREGVHLLPLFHGGAQQDGTRPGTENVAGIVALAKAMRIVKEREGEERIHLRGLQMKAIESLRGLQHMRINTPIESGFTSPHILNISFMGIKPEVIVHALEERGILISTRSACSSKVQKPSRILTAMGLKEDEANSAIRISFSAINTTQEIEYLGKVMQEIVPYYQKIMKV